MLPTFLFKEAALQIGLHKKMRLFRDKLKTFCLPEDDEVLLHWASSLYYELSLVQSSLERRGKPEIFEYFILRLLQYKRDFPSLSASGDFEIVKRIILAEIRLNEIDELPLEEISDSPKLIDAFTKLHTQLTKDIEAIGVTSKQRKKSQLDTLKVIIDHSELSKVLDSEAKADEWLESHSALPTVV